MTIDPNRPAVGPANIDPGPRIGFTHDGKERIGGGENSWTVTHSTSDQVARARAHARWPTGTVEETDLERRVLAHERILQALIAHMAEADPQFIARLSAVFSDPLPAGRREHDYTDTHAYADQFVQGVRRLIERRKEQDAAREPTPAPAGGKSSDAFTPPHEPAVTQIAVRYRAGIWELTKDGRFFGHYTRDQPAFDAAEAAAFAVIAGGGAADVQWNDARPRPGGRAKDPGVAPIGVMRTMQFRTGPSARVQ